MWKRLSRSELLSTFFPTWIWQGREWSKWRIPKYDPYYWINSHAHPVLSTYYMPHVLLSIFASLGFSKHHLNAKFNVLVFLLLCHIALSFLGWFCLVQIYSTYLVALFGATTFTFSAYNWKQQPCFQYTVAWFPWLLLGIATNNQFLAGFALGMVFLAGYYPIGLQIEIIAIGASFLWKTAFWWVLIGLVIGLVQLIPFLKYRPQTIHMEHDDSGRIPWWHPITLVFPKSFRYYINGVGHWEMSYYVGIVPLLLLGWSSSRVWILGVVSYLLMLGLGAKYFPRIPARWCFTFQFALGWMAISGLTNLNLPPSVLMVVLFIQAFDLWLNNKDLLVNHPYAELYQKPSWAFNTRLTRYLKENLNEGEKVAGLPYPLFCGHINSIHTIGYCGSMQSKEMWAWRKSFNHDPFIDGVNQNDLNKRRIKYAYTATKLNWKHTGIPRLFRNPNIS